ncbi:ATP-binding cassette domain-containing protein [Candidatus Micrarchaeota archaeon]|nr:ATP-binding cassette domain-containing protein [Candidatus Micrarchaeota archaeon]
MSTTDYVIEVNNLIKKFNVPVKPKGLMDRVRQVFLRRWKSFIAVNNISFNVEKGEFLGYLGPNGSGKTTTIKMLSGVLTPTSGQVKCLGRVPWKREREYLKRIGVLFGNRSNLIFDIALEESFLLYKDIYELSDEFYAERMKIFRKMLDLDKILHIPVRKLSFGQRMRGELGVVFLHKPEIVFLDEPTIGIDPLAKERIHIFLREINKRDNVTIVLTTHNIGDIEELCKRVIIMNKGKVIYDGSVSRLKKRYVKSKDILIDYFEIKDRKSVSEIKRMLKDIEIEGTSIKGKLPKNKQKVFFELLTKAYNILELNVMEPPLENIIREIYRSGEK